MKFKRGPAANRTQLVDALIDCYVTWREECRAVAASYQNWRCATRPDRAPAFDEYLHALDREEQAACAYQALIEQVAHT